MSKMIHFLSQFQETRKLTSRSNRFFRHIFVRYIYFSYSFLFVSPSRDLWNYFTVRVNESWICLANIHITNIIYVC